MAENDRSFCRLENVAHCLCRDMRNIDDDSEAVHFADHFFAKSRNAVMSWFVVAAVGEVVRFVGKGHTSQAKLIKAAKQRHIVLKTYRSFHYRKDRYSPRSHCGPHF